MRKIIIPCGKYFLLNDKTTHWPQENFEQDKKQLEFYLNNFYWIQWIMPKLKNGMVTRAITYLKTNTLPVIEIKSIFPSLPLGWYILPLTLHLPRCGEEIFIFTTSSCNIYICVQIWYILYKHTTSGIALIHWNYSLCNGNGPKWECLFQSILTDINDIMKDIKNILNDIKENISRDTSI